MTTVHQLTIELFGVLQGVGFRPTIARAVRSAGLTGWVRNESSRVRLVLQGSPEVIDQFVDNLGTVLPAAAQLGKVVVTERRTVLAKEASTEFVILESASDEGFRPSIPADLAMCRACRDEVLDPESRFHAYPFTSCTDCGPRYTVVTGMPYDRGRTALAPFPLCEQCRADYRDPNSRRYHAESIACPDCGPSLQLVNPQGKPLAGDPLQVARLAIRNGKIVGVRGLGGFLLVCDALNERAVANLRERKRRPAKPFAVMAPDLETVRNYCEVDDGEAAQLKSGVAPIVVLKLKPKWRDDTLILGLSPTSDTLGVMLPPTPLQLLLATGTSKDDYRFPLLVMTSGNCHGEPICTGNEEAVFKLGAFVDLFLLHNRHIEFRCDDSLVRSFDGAFMVLRRARGLSPGSVQVPGPPLEKTILAMGADLKNTVALGFDGEVVISPHIGDLAAPSAQDGMRQVLDTFPAYYRKSPEQVVCDLHPDMHATRIGRHYAASLGIPVVAVQHHHAHGAAALAEWGKVEGLALAFDGTGMGTDGTIWGGELLHVFPGGFTRLAHFAPSMLPGGDQAVWDPRRQVVARLFDLDGNPDDSLCSHLGLSTETTAMWTLQCERGLNAPLTSAAGRLFDAAAALLGILGRPISYEGEGAILLERAAARHGLLGVDALPFDDVIKDGILVVDPRPAFEVLFGAVKAGSCDQGRLAAAFHLMMANAAKKMVEFGTERSGQSDVVLCGGVMMNELLALELHNHLKYHRGGVFLPSAIPVNDGGIAFGQIIAAKGS